MESAKAIHNFILPALEKFQIDLNLPFLMVRFQDTVGNEISIFRFENSYLAVTQSFGEDDRRDAIEIGLCVQDDDWIPVSYGKGKYYLKGADMSEDGTRLEEVKLRTMKKVAKKCGDWVDKIVKSNGCHDCLTPIMFQYHEDRLLVKKFYPVTRKI